jgi:hypothetical protein
MDRLARVRKRLSFRRRDTYQAECIDLTSPADGFGLSPEFQMQVCQCDTGASGTFHIHNGPYRTNGVLLTDGDWIMKCPDGDFMVRSIEQLTKEFRSEYVRVAVDEGASEGDIFLAPGDNLGLRGAMSIKCSSNDEGDIVLRINIDRRRVK